MSICRNPCVTELSDLTAFRERLLPDGQREMRRLDDKRGMIIVFGVDVLT